MPVEVATDDESARFSATGKVRMMQVEVDKLNSLPIQTWNKAEGDSVRHIGPVSQDFKAAFNLGADDKAISTVDADGVTMAAVQGLYQMMLEKEKRLEQQARQIEQLQSRVMQLERASKRNRKRRR